MNSFAIAFLAIFVGFQQQEQQEEVLEPVKTMVASEVEPLRRRFLAGIEELRTDRVARKGLFDSLQQTRKETLEAKAKLEEAKASLVDAKTALARERRKAIQAMSLAIIAVCISGVAIFRSFF